MASAVSNDRFERTVKRIAAEAYWLYTYQRAICGLTVDAIGLDFFRVSLNAFKDARLIRLMRVLEDDSRTASFWYLCRTNENAVKKATKASALDIDRLRDVATRLRGIRDKTFVHIDKDGVFDPQKFYQVAGIKHEDVDYAIAKLWLTMQFLHKDVIGEEILGDAYTGEDIKLLADLRDAHLSNLSLHTDATRR